MRLSSNTTAEWSAFPSRPVYSTAPTHAFETALCLRNFPSIEQISTTIPTIGLIFLSGRTRDMRPPGTAPRVVYRRQPKYPQSMGRNTPGLTLPPPASSVEAPSVWSRQSDAFLKGRKCLRCTSREVCRRIGTPLSDEVHDHTNKNIPFYVKSTAALAK